MSLITTAPAPELTRDVKVVHRHGLHILPATELVKLVRTFHSAITVTLGTETVDARSIMSLLLLAAHHGAVLTFTAKGDDAAEALHCIEELFSKEFSNIL